MPDLEGGKNINPQWSPDGGQLYFLSDAHGGPNRPQHVYNVHFSARELWGDDAPERDGIYLDLWEEYLEAPSTNDVRA